MTGLVAALALAGSSARAGVMYGVRTGKGYSIVSSEGPGGISDSISTGHIRPAQISCDPGTNLVAVSGTRDGSWFVGVGRRGEALARFAKVAGPVISQALTSKGLMALLKVKRKLVWLRATRLSDGAVRVANVCTLGRQLTAIDADGRVWQEAPGNSLRSMDGRRRLFFAPGEIIVELTRAEPNGPIIVVTDRHAYALWKGRLERHTRLGGQVLESVWSSQVQMVTQHLLVAPPGQSPVIRYDDFIIGYSVNARKGGKTVMTWESVPIPPYDMLLSSTEDASNFLLLRMGEKTDVATVVNSDGQEVKRWPVPKSAFALTGYFR